jgi:hypothetical protein
MGHNEVDPSPEDREKIREVLQIAHAASKSKMDDAEVFLKENKKDLDPEVKHEAEHDVQKYRRYSETLEDALTKSENTKGRTLKKAFGKRTMSVVC